jgi:hypothetical protein
MGQGYPRRENRDYRVPQVAPGRAYRRDAWRWLRVLLIVTFFLFDLLGVIVLFFPHVISQSPALNVGPQVVGFLTPAGNPSPAVGAAPSLAPTAPATSGPIVIQPATPESPATASATLSASATPSSTATGAAANHAPGLYVQALRTDPQTPRRNQDIYFFVTFVNTTGIGQALRWDVLVYRPEKLNQYFGQSLPIGKGDSIAAGIQELRSSGPYKLFGGGGCQDVVFRVARMDGDKPAALIDQPDGKPFLQTTRLCP